MLLYCCGTRSNSRLSSALQQVKELEQANNDLVCEVQQLSLREAEHLEFSSRLTEKNGFLQAENSQLSMKVYSALGFSVNLIHHCFVFVVN